MRMQIAVVGFTLGVILFIFFSAFGRVGQQLLKPLICPDGQYVQTDTTYIGDDNQEHPATNNWCETNGKRSGIDGYMVLLNVLSCLVPAGLAGALQVVVNKLFPPAPAAINPP